MIRGFGALSKAMLLGYVRDRASLVFTILFPLLFLFLFGGLFESREAPRLRVLVVGEVGVLTDAPAPVRQQLDEVLEIEPAASLESAVAAVADGDYAAAIDQDGDDVIVHFSVADQVRAGTVFNTLQAVVQQANLAETGTPPRFSIAAQQVEDRSLKTVQYLTPGLLGWAVATAATFGGALTLVAWRRRMILRRLRLAPISTAPIVLARVGVTVVIALLQTAIFLGVAKLPMFGLQLSGDWWMAIPLVLAGSLAFLAVGQLAGAIAKTEEAAGIFTNLFVLPMAFLSGSFFRLDNAPSWLRDFSQILPLRHLNNAMLDVMVRDKPALSVLPELGLLLGFAAVVSLVAIRFFRWDDA
jgi:ABC-2 type transport system permease protein